MEQSFPNSSLNQKFKELKQAISTFEEAIDIDLSLFNGIELDTIKSGQIQKFEYTIELTWKFLKSYLRKEKGVDAQGPKDVFREFAKFNHFTKKQVQTFILMIDDRNSIAHEYKDYIMDVIYPKLIGYRKLIKNILEISF